MKARTSSPRAFVTVFQKFEAGVKALNAARWSPCSIIGTVSHETITTVGRYTQWRLTNDLDEAADDAIYDHPPKEGMP